MLHLAGIDPDPTVEAAASLVSDSLRSMFQTCGDQVPVHHEKIRTALEVNKYMAKYRFQYSHLVLIGHGGVDGITLLDKPSPLANDRFAELLGCSDGCRQIDVISLCCHSGCPDMAKALSKDDSVGVVVAPEGPFDMRWAAIFVQGYILKTLDEGLSPSDAVKALKFDQPMCVWNSGDCDHCRD